MVAEVISIKLGRKATLTVIQLQIPDVQLESFDDYFKRIWPNSLKAADSLDGDDMQQWKLVAYMAGAKATDTCHASISTPTARSIGNQSLSRASKLASSY